MMGTDESLRSRENFPNNTVLQRIHRICHVLILLSTGLLIGAGTLTGNVEKRSLQSTLYKIGYFDFLAVFVVAVLLGLRIYVLQHDRVKYQHLTVSPSAIPLQCTQSMSLSYREPTLTTLGNPRS
jgi:Ni,Fe-hydrogenase I cytochrome b subunit